METEPTQKPVDAKSAKRADKASKNIAKIPTRKHLIKFAAPTIISMMIMSTFGIVDGIFVSRLIDPFALSAVGLVWPFMSFVVAIGFMLGVGGNALVAKMIGEKRVREARQIFSLISAVAFIASILVAMIGFFAPYFILNILGVDDFIRPMAIEYMTPFVFFLPTAVLGMVLQQFLITAGKAHYSAVMALFSGFISAGLNYVFIYQMEMGLRGAALATSAGFTLPAVVGIVYFTFARKGDLYFVMPRFHLRALRRLGRSCVNGASEMVTSLATSVTAVLMNNKLMSMEGAGPEAVAASAIMWAGMGIFSSIFIGYSSGIAPIISYNYGKKDEKNLKRVFKNSLQIIAVLAVLSTVLALSTVDVLTFIYDVPQSSDIHRLVRVGYVFITCTFLLLGFNMFTSMFFTALNNGVVSSILALFNMFIFYVIALYSLSPFFGLYGVWGAIPVADTLQIFLSIFVLMKMRKRYGYA